MNRPTLIPGLPRIWRGDNELQLGSDPARAVVLQLPDPRAALLLDLLDGTRPERAVLLHAAGQGVPPAEARALLDTLHAAGLVLPAAALIPAALADHTRHRLLSEAASLAWQNLATDPPDPAATPARTLRRRADARVVIAGHGRLGAGIAVALAEAGVGHVHPDLPGLVGPGELAGGPLRQTDIGRPRRETVAAAIQQVAPTTQTHGVRRTPASLVVQLDHDQPVALVAAAHLARHQPHLAVTIREGAAVIGPLVAATGAPCLQCLDLHRRERDAAWPGGPQRKSAEPAAVTTLLTATAYATAEALTFLDGATPPTPGAAAEIAVPGRVRRRTWPPHPSCPCARHQHPEAPAHPPPRASATGPPAPRTQ